LLLSLDSDPCSPNPCKNGGTCTDITKFPKRDELYVCECAHQFFGRFCDVKGVTLLVNYFRIADKEKQYANNMFDT
jgi:hypothetical protein